jgi:hypothetical protein
MGFYKREFKLEKVFLELMGECRKEAIEGLWDKELEIYIKMTLNAITGQGQLFAYGLLFLNDEEAAGKALELFEKLSSSHPNMAEAALERKLVGQSKLKAKQKAAANN